MSNVSTSLNYLLSLKAEYNNDIVEQMKWSQLQKNNAKKLSAMEKAQSKWQDAYDKATDGTRSTELKFNDGTGRVIEKETAADEPLATQWADYKAPQYDEDILDELEDLDVEYTQMQAIFDTKVEQEKAEIEKLEQLTSEGAQDTGMLGQ